MLLVDDHQAEPLEERRVFEDRVRTDHELRLARGNARKRLLPHWSAANRSTQSRVAYSLHVIDGTARYPADNWLCRRPEMPLRGF